jgi:magnesium-protoporphyrin O-methyltransferase
MMTALAPSPAYENRRARLETYFDRTALDAWAQLTSDAPVSKIRATVRAGRDEMRGVLMTWLPEKLHGLSVRDAGCGTGALAVAAARRGAHVTAVDVSASLIDIAKERAPRDVSPGEIAFKVGDMLNPGFGETDYAVAMDSLIHYPAEEIVRALSALAGQTRRAILFTFAPQTPALTLMHAAGRFFPRADRAPAIEPVSESHLRKAIAAAPQLKGWSVSRGQRVSSGFYMSHALELSRG